MTTTSLRLRWLLAATLTGVASSAMAGEVAGGVPQQIAQLQQRVQQLQSDVGELQALSLPIDIDVNCGAGNSVSSVLATHASGHAPLTIRVSGICNESVSISRDNVTLIGSEGAVIQTTPSTTYGVIVTAGAKKVSVSDLRIVGGQGAAVVSKSAHGVFTNIIAEQSNLGMAAADNGTIEITGSTLRQNNNGVYATRGGLALVSNSVIETNQVGAFAYKNGNINLTSSLPSGFPGPAGVTVRNNNVGALARSGGTLEFSDSNIEGNAVAGVLADTGSTLHFFSSLNGQGNVVSNNAGAGVVAQKGTSLVFATSTNSITGNNVGISCHPGVGYVVTPTGPGDVSGNRLAQINGCTPN